MKSANGGQGGLEAVWHAAVAGGCWSALEHSRRTGSYSFSLSIKLNGVTLNQAKM